jgi:hypothetical protein
MSWARLDDNSLDDPQIVSVEPLAELFYFRARIYIERHHTRGIVPRGAVSTLARGFSGYRLHVRPYNLIEQLIRVRLLEERDQDLYVVGWERWTRPERDPNELRTAAQLGGKRSAEARRLKYGTAQPVEANLEANRFGVLRTSRDGSGRGMTPGESEDSRQREQPVLDGVNPAVDVDPDDVPDFDVASDQTHRGGSR